MQKLKFTHPIKNKEVTAHRSDLIAIHKIENDSLCKLAKLNQATIYSTNFKKQKVTLVLNIFNERNAALLDSKDCNDTAIFVKASMELHQC